MQNFEPYPTVHLFKPFIMKKDFQFLKLICIVLLGGGLMYSCKKNDVSPDDPGNPGNPVVINADTIANRLRLVNATKKTGAIPKGPAVSSLKISFDDTLYLVDKWKLPVKFLHEDSTKNVAGVYIQVHKGSGAATFYYDVPEVPDIATNDSISVILVGIDPKDLIDSAFGLTIVPHDPSGQALGGVFVPVDILTPTADLSDLISEQGEYWNWSMSSIPDPNNPTGIDIFFNSPNKLWGLLGQNIRGCCTNGHSEYTANCDSANFRFLNFQTFFNWPSELYKFFDDGTYAGLSEYISAAPDPQASNFCGSGPGVVNEHFLRSFLQGTWTVNSSNFLSTLGTSTPQSGGVAARPDGRIDLVSSRLLIIFQPDREGGSRGLVKFYTLKNSSSPEWYPF